MKLTRAGLGAAFMAALTLAAAASSGNNLLYLLHSVLLSGFLVSWAAGRLNLRGVEVGLDVPEQMFRGSDFHLGVSLRGLGRLRRRSLRVRRGASGALLPCLNPGEPVRSPLPCRAELRGWNRLDGLFLESSHPFGWLLHRRALPSAEALVLPRVREARSPAELRSDVDRTGDPAARKGRGGELFGVRDYDPSDDVRSINWKRTAKTGTVMVNEFAEEAGPRITVRLATSGGNLEAEAAIEEAASACRYYIDSGAEVRLATPESRTEYGRGPLHLEQLLRALALLGEGKKPRPSPVATPASPEPGMQEPDALPLALSGIAAAYASLFLVEEIDPLLLRGLAPVLGLGALAQWRGGPWLPRGFWTAASCAMLAYVLGLGWRLSGITVANAHLILYLLSHQALNPLRREGMGRLLVVLYLAFFMVSGMTVSLWYFPFFLLFLSICAPWLRASCGGRLGPWRSWGPPSAALLASCLGLCAVLFAATPRIDPAYRSNPLVNALGLDKLQPRGSAVTGFTENVSLGFFGELKRSGARVLRVKPGSAPPPPARPAPLRIRGAAFDVFDGRRWSKSRVEFLYRLGTKTYWSAGGRAWVPRGGNRLLFPAGDLQRERGGLNSLEFTVYPMNASVIFTAEGLSSIEASEGAAYFDHTDTAYFGAPYLMGTRYLALGGGGTIGFGAHVPDYESLLRARFLQLPPESALPGARLRELARSVASGREDELGKVRAVESFLRRGFRYSTFSSSERFGLEDFLFSVRSGNCEYFASAAVILLRHAGIPARLVTGFLAQDWNEYGRFYDVRQSQAHAWAEAYVRGAGWVGLDPTPAEGWAEAARNTFSDRAVRYFNAVQARWYRHVIGYDPYIQRNTFRKLGTSISRQALRRAARPGLAGLCAAAALLAALEGLRRFKHRDKSRDFYLRAQRELSRAGLPRPPQLTPREYARWVVSRDPALAPVAALAELHYLERYASSPLTPDQKARAGALLSELRSGLSRRPKGAGWKQATHRLGALSCHPEGPVKEGGPGRRPGGTQGSPKGPGAQG